MLRRYVRNVTEMCTLGKKVWSGHNLTFYLTIWTLLS
jgi:hypothetical protein